MDVLEKAIIGVVSIIVLIIVVALLFVNMWPQVTTVAANVTAMSGTDAGTTVFKGLFTVVLIIGGVAIAVGLVIWVLKYLHVGGQ